MLQVLLYWHRCVGGSKQEEMNDEDYGFFGLTFDEYQILLEDIGQAAEEGNRKYGYGYGYGGYVEPELKVKSRPKPRLKHRRKPSVEQVAITRGIIKVISFSTPSSLVSVSTKTKKEKEEASH